MAAEAAAKTALAKQAKKFEAITISPNDANVYDRTAMPLSGVDRNQAFEKSFQLIILTLVSQTCVMFLCYSCYFFPSLLFFLIS